jgi:hypothetical protein
MSKADAVALALQSARWGRRFARDTLAGETRDDAAAIA